MRVFLTVAAAVALFALPLIASDVLADAPRLARWIARRAERWIPYEQREFYGWTAEIESAALDAANGLRSRVSVLVLAVGMVRAAVQLRVSRAEVSDAINHGPDGEAAYIRIPLNDGDGFEGESVWAFPVGDDSDLFRIDNHVVFSDETRIGDVVRAKWVPIEELPGHGVLEFVEVVEPSDHVELSLWHHWRVRPDRRYRRLHRNLLDLGMDSEWMSSVGRGSLPEGPERAKVLRLLRRRRVRWAVVERPQS